MDDFFRFLGASLSPSAIDGVLERWQSLLFPGNLFVWLFVVMLLRYDLPAFIVWIVNALNPRAFRSPVMKDAYLPYVSVVIAGRNPGAAIERTIHSVLDSRYPRLEVLYADDCSNDDSVARARAFERTGMVRVFASDQHSGKPTNLNIAILMARGELTFVLDSDTEIEVGTIHRLAAYFSDPRIGAVTANIYVRNATHNLLTRLQEFEYALNGTIARLWHARVGLLAILPGAASMFRTAALRELGGFDAGLGDDTDMTIRMRKRGWALAFALDARVWSDEPEAVPALLRQRFRWSRNMVKIRLRKHADLLNPARYGLANMLLALDNLLFRVILPLVAVVAITRGFIEVGPERSILFTGLYGLVVFLLCCKALIANDLAGTPPLYDLALAPLYPLYRFVLRTVDAFAITRELLRIRLYHPYVPRRVWKEIPHW